MVKKTIKLQIWIVASICLLSMMGTFLLLQNTRLNMQNVLSSSTLVKGLEPGTKVTVNILKSQYDENNQGEQEFNDTLVVNDQGEIYLPPFRPDYKFYSIQIDNDINPIMLNVTYNHVTERLNIQGNGFEKFSDVFISRGEDDRKTKTDWAGLFSEQEIVSAIDFQTNEDIKFAFQGFMMDRESLGDSPIKLEVVIGIGGTETDADVNVYDPPIGDGTHCSESTTATDGDDVFWISTCDVARMQALTADGSCTGGPPCNSSADTVEQNLIHPLMLMAEQLTAVMMQQMGILGSLMDAKEQNEAIRDFRTLAAQAHKDYHPSEQMCRFGTYVRSISQAEERYESEKKAFNQILSYYYNSPEEMSSSEGYSVDISSRVEQFKETYCNPNDNDAALWMLCRSETITLPPPATSAVAAERLRYNKDIDYFYTLEKPLTLDVDFTNDVGSEKEVDLIALAKNLYWPKTYDLGPWSEYVDGFPDNYSLVLAARNINTKLSLAHNSFATIVGMKAQTNNDTAATGLGDASGGAHLKALLREFGLSDVDIDLLVGENPSYYAQMEILAKKIYQNPTFYTNLYDKPVNVDRINVSLEAFQNMHMRDRYESLLRQEMLISMLVEEGIMERAEELNSEVARKSGSTAKPQAGTGY